MVSVSDLISSMRKSLIEMRDTGDVSKLDKLIITAIVTENMFQHVRDKKGCDKCPSYGK